jgi:FkbM family methyltransferase
VKTIEKFLHSDEFALKHSSFVARYVGKDARRFTNDVSEYGEVEILIKTMGNRLARHRIIVDVGVRGRQGSNSFDLLQHFGWTGLLVEANPHSISQIRDDLAGLNVTILNLAVSDYIGKAAFYLGENVSSLTKQIVEDWGPCAGAMEVEVRRLGEILDAHAIPPDFDVLSLDIEGEDLRVLNDLILSTRYRPRWIIIEASFEFKVKTLSDLDLCEEVKGVYSILGQTSANLLLGQCPSSDDLGQVAM